MDIPIKYIKFCQELGRLAREYELSSLSGSFHDLDLARANIKIINFNWDSGRHNDGTGNISIHAEAWLTTKVDEGEVAS